MAALFFHCNKSAGSAYIHKKTIDSMEFLREVARTFLDREKQLEDFCFVFPNRRSMKFFQKYLGEEAGSPMISPVVMTINDFFISQSDLVSADKLKLMHVLWQVYIGLSGKDPVKNSFDDFIYWGDILLGDFDDVDKYMADAGALFSNLSDLKEIDSGFSFLEEEQVELIRRFWNTFRSTSPSGEGADRLIDTQDEFCRFWNLLNGVYEEFRRRLEAEGIGYEGMIYRKVADLFAQDEIPGIERYRQIVFVGLNAPNKCERFVLDRLRDLGKGDFYWDFYGSIIRDRDNSASYFMKEYEKRYPSRYPIEKNEEGWPEYGKFNLYSVPSAVAQTKVAHEILRDIAASGDSDFVETAVVLPDESLLLPMLDSVPENIGEVNVTMGYPLQCSPAMSFITLVGELQKLVKVEGKVKKFYFKPLLSLLYHPYITSPLSQYLKSEIGRRKLYYISREELIELIDSFRKAPHGAFPEFEIYRELLSDYLFLHPEDIYDYLKAMLVKISPRLGKVEKESVFYCYREVNKLKSLDLPIAAKTVFRILKQLLSTAKIPYKGEPLSGLQIMGTLETRALDFRNVIILSANDGVFPASSRGNSYIPYNLRKAFDLPNYEYQDSVYAYYFYRLISRAENVYIVYNTSSIDKNIKEVSRYVSQLKLHYKLPITDVAVHQSVGTVEMVPESIEKTEDMIQRLYEKYSEDPGTEKASKGNFSASLLNSYLACPAKFYYQAVEGLMEEEEIDEKIDARVYGNVLHKSMELLYGPELNRILTPEIFQRILKNRSKIESVVTDCLKEELKVSEITGQNLIYRTLLVRSVEKVIDVDSRSAQSSPFYVAGVEQKMTPKIEIDGHRLRFKAIIDRVDRLDDRHRLVDYKTGSVDEKGFSLNMDQVMKVPQLFQVCFYAYLCSREHLLNESEEVTVSLYVLRSMFREGKTLEVGLSPDFIHDFEERLNALMKEIFDRNVPFARTEDEKQCEYCAYRILCKR